MMRIGHGFDAHRFTDTTDNRSLVLCGVTIDHPQGLRAHSDGDVAIHALCDALFGAVAAGDIGSHFPDTAIENHNRPSKDFLAKAHQVINEHGYHIANLDMTIICERPKLKPYIPVMQKTLAHYLQLNIDAISIKATTTEKMGYTGRQEGISCHCVTLLYQTTLRA
jgi:2-C-methyl-D-erythritol 2,4-cyclodiphosphate synthase